MATVDETPKKVSGENPDSEKFDFKNSAEMKLILYIVPVGAVIALISYLLSR